MKTIPMQDFLELLKNRGTHLTVTTPMCDEFGVPERDAIIFREGITYDFRGQKKEGDAADEALQLLSIGASLMSDEITITSSNKLDKEITGKYRLILTDLVRTVITISPPEGGHEDVAFYGPVTVMNATPSGFRVVDKAGSSITISSDELVDLKAVGHPIALTDCPTENTKRQFDRLQLPIRAAALVQDFGDLIKKTGIGYNEGYLHEQFDCDIVFDEKTERFALLAAGTGHVAEAHHTLIASPASVRSAGDIEEYINEFLEIQNV